MIFPDEVTWLQERTTLNILDREVLEAIAPTLEELVVPAKQTLVREDTPPEGLYILRSGHLESKGKTAATVGLLPGTAINLKALILDQPVEYTITTLNESQFWLISASKFRSLLEKYPEITQAFSQKLAEEVEKLSSQLIHEQERQNILRPYLVTKAKQGIIGKSRYAIRLRSQIKQAAENRQAVLIFWRTRTKQR